MNARDSKRKRSVPEWMKSPTKTASGGNVDGNVSHIHKTKRPSYPPISIKKTKQLDRSLENAVKSSTLTSSKSVSTPSCSGVTRQKEGERQPHFMNDSFELPLYSPENEVPDELEEFCMTVDDLTRVAQEVINEERQRKKLV